MSGAPRILIFCQGKQQRLAAHLKGPKQLTKIGRGETILGRTVSLLRSRGMTDIHVIAPGSPVWREFAASEGVVLRTLTHPGETTLDGVFAARRHWLVQKSAVLLLGDVVFSEKTIDLIGEDRGGMRFYGRLGANAVTGCPWGELFGMRISVRRQRMVLRLLAKPAFRHGRSHGTGFGLLWNLYYEMLETVGSSILLDPNDFTDDIDTPADLAALPRLNNAIRSEGLMRSRLGAK